MAIKSADQITIIDVTDAYSVILTSETYTFVGGNNGVASGNSCATQAVAYCGASQCTVVEVDEDDIVCPSGISASVTSSGTAAVTITFTTTATISTDCEATIPVTVDGVTVNKKFSFAVAKTGAKGEDGISITISSTEVKYVASDSGTTTPGSSANWSTTVPTVENGQFLWTRTIVNYSDETSTTSYAVSYKGTNGTNGTSVAISSTSVTYQASSSGTTTPTGIWQSAVPSVNEGQYLWTKTYVKYSDNTEATSYSVSYKGTNGTDGNDGKDAIAMTITASNGTVFKNSSGSTVLTAHVFVGGVEQTITDAGVCGSYGSVKWYKGTNLTATAKTLTVLASAVNGSQAYTVQLEN